MCVQCAQREGAVSARRLALVEATTLAHARRVRAHASAHVGEAFGRRACRRLSSSMAMSPFTSVASAPAADRAAMASTTSASARIVIAGRERTRAVGGGYTTASYKDYAVKAARLFTVSPNRAESRPQVFVRFYPPFDCYSPEVSHVSVRVVSPDPAGPPIAALPQRTRRPGSWGAAQARMARAAAPEIGPTSKATLWSPPLCRTRLALPGRFAKWP